jgi:HEPN domain-containing protein
MAKTRQQVQAKDYAMDYLEHLLKMEDLLDRKLDFHIEQAVRKYIKEVIGVKSEEENNEA